jgi:hypothetical protein
MKLTTFLTHAEINNRWMYYLHFHPQTPSCRDVELSTKTICRAKCLWNEQYKGHCIQLISTYSTVLLYEPRVLNCAHAIWLQQQLCRTWLCLIHHLAASEIVTAKLTSFSIASATKSVEKWEKIHGQCTIEHCCPVSSISASSSGGSRF